MCVCAGCVMWWPNQNEENHVRRQRHRSKFMTVECSGEPGIGSVIMLFGAHIEPTSISKNGMKKSRGNGDAFVVSVCMRVPSRRGNPNWFVLIPRRVRCWKYLIRNEKPSNQTVAKAEKCKIWTRQTEQKMCRHRGKKQICCLSCQRRRARKKRTRTHTRKTVFVWPHVSMICHRHMSRTLYFGSTWLT